LLFRFWNEVKVYFKVSLNGGECGVSTCEFPFMIEKFLAGRLFNAPIVMQLTLFPPSSSSTSSVSAIPLPSL
jgi:hypothetical protein